MPSTQRFQGMTPIQRALRAEKKLLDLNTKLESEQAALHRAVNADTTKIRSWQQVYWMETEVSLAKVAIRTTKESIRKWKAYELKHQVAHMAGRHGIVKKQGRDDDEAPGGHGIKVEAQPKQPILLPLDDAVNTAIEAEEGIKKPILPVSGDQVDVAAKVESDGTKKPILPTRDGPGKVAVKSEKKDEGLDITMDVFATLVRSANLFVTKNGFKDVDHGDINQQEHDSLAVGLKAFGNKVLEDAKSRKASNVSENRTGKRKAETQDGTTKRTKGQEPSL